MYRLFKAQGTTFFQYSHASLRLINNKRNLCLLCKLNKTSTDFIRHNSTNANPSLKYKRLKGKRKVYSELLIVTENSSCQRRANIKKLTFSDLELLATSNLNLSELYKLKELSQKGVIHEHTYNNLNIIDHFPTSNLDSQTDLINPNLDCNTERIVNLDLPEIFKPKQIVETPPELLIEASELSNEQEHIEQEVELESIKVVNTFQPEVTEEQILEVEEVKGPPDKPVIKGVMDHKRREEIITKTIAAYAEICGHLKNPQRGLALLHFHRSKARRMSNKMYIPIKTPTVYNALLKGFAHKGDYPKVKEILDVMKEERVKRTVQTYVGIFECLARIDIKDYTRELKMYTMNALSQNITFNKIMDKAVFLNNERELVLKAMRCVDVNYTPKFKPPTVLYNNQLVNHLNHPHQKKAFIPNTDECNGLFESSKLQELVDKQIDLEKAGYITIKSVASKDKVSVEVVRNRISLEDHYKMWEDAALKAFNRDLATLTAQRSAMNMEPYIRAIPAKDCVAIIIEEAKKMAQGSETYSPTVNMLYRELGNKVYARYKVLCKQKSGVLDKIIKIHKTYCKQYANLHQPLEVLPTEEVILNSRHNWQLIDHYLKGEGATLNMDHQEWVPTVLMFIGKFLYHIVMYDLKVDVNVLRNIKHKNYLPAFYTIFRTQGRIVKEEVKPHPILSKLYRQSNLETLTFPTGDVPMVCPPLPWTSTEMGGYLVSPCEVIRLPIQASTQKCRLSEAGSQQLYPSLDALNQLASVPWKVNTDILDVVLEVFNSGGSAKLDVPEPPSSLTSPPNPTSEMDKADRYQIFKQKLQFRRKKAEMYSLWCDCLYRLSLANHFRDDIFWLPHNMDFRGRVYPVPPHLNHLGSDLARSMLVFAEPRPLGPDGLDWLKIHLINLTGLKKKESIQKRLDYANEILHLIVDSAENPLNGKRWWADSDEPWQTLACCLEITKVIRSGDPENFLSHFPVHQDGSCNGLQHYAALGRDASGAFSVNLATSDVPQDVYSAVVSLVEKQRFIDAENGNTIAKALEGVVKRKVVKQTIMTTVYGVTRFGARLQIARQLKDIDEFPKDLVWAASSYLTGRTFDSLRTMFTSTREIQDWFTECARLISSVGAQQVEWVTPLGLPIVQPYFKYRKAPTAGSTYESFTIDKYEKPNVLKQKNAFPPNFIHSLDSSHMMLTSLHCERAGIAFVSVHDCYWTHPSTVPIMNKICREQFVALHSEPILEDLSNFLWEKFRYDQSEFAKDGSVLELTKKKLNRTLRQLPQTGDFDINQVLKSVYFFS